MKTAENIKKIRIYLEDYGESKTSDIAKYIGLSPARTRVILAEMKELQINYDSLDRNERRLSVQI